MKRKILSIILALILVLAYTVPAAAAEKISDDEAIQKAYEQLVEVNAAMSEGSYDYNAMATALDKLEKTTSEFTDEQSEEWTNIAETNKIGTKTFLDIIFDASAIVAAAEAWDAYKTDPKESKALEFTTDYSYAKNLGAPVDEMLPGIADAYTAALSNLPSEEVMDVYEAYEALRTALSCPVYDEDFVAAYEGFEAVLDTYNELSNADMAVLADLIEAEDGETAYNQILSDWINANMIKQIAEAEAAYAANPNAQTAKAYVDVYESVFNSNMFTQEDLDLFLEFFGDATYEDAKTLLANDGADSGEKGPVVEPPENPEKPVTPATGDDFSLYGLMALMATSAAVGAAALRKRVQ